MKNKIFKVIGSLFLLAILSITLVNLSEDMPLFQGKPEFNDNIIELMQVEVGDVTIGFDPRLELLASVELNSEFYNIVKYDTKYKRDMKKHFRRFRNHDVIKLFKELSKDGLYVDIPPAFMLHLTEVPSLKIKNEINENIISSSNIKEFYPELVLAFE